MKTNRSIYLYCLVMFICSMYSLLSKTSFSGQESNLSDTNSVNLKSDENWAFQYWHTGRNPFTQLALTTVEQRFAKGFPGALARFTDGQTIWVVRHVKEATRMLHPAVDCFHGLGYQVSTVKVVEQMNGSRWRCFLAEHGQKLKVCERIFDAENRQWTDVSAWYWENIFKSGQNEWWAVTQVSRADTVNL